MFNPCSTGLSPPKFQDIAKISQEPLSKSDLEACSQAQSLKGPNYRKFGPAFVEGEVQKLLDTIEISAHLLPEPYLQGHVLRQGHSTCSCASVSKGVKREYVRVVEAYHDHAGKTRHRTIINLGRKDLLAAHLDFEKLQRLLHGDARRPDHSKREDVDAIGAWDWV